jgi:hypothetical protein
VPLKTFLAVMKFKKKRTNQRFLVPYKNVAIEIEDSKGHETNNSSCFHCMISIFLSNTYTSIPIFISKKENKTCQLQQLNQHLNPSRASSIPALKVTKRAALLLTNNNKKTSFKLVVAVGLVRSDKLLRSSVIIKMQVPAG